MYDRFVKTDLRSKSNYRASISNDTCGGKCSNLHGLPMCLDDILHDHYARS